VCFDKRFLVSAQKALEIGEKKITTTLLVSPLKSQEQLKRVGDAFYKQYGVEFIALDYRSGGGTQDQSRVTKEQQLYRQDYCGCIYGLTLQRKQQEKLMDEMFSAISGAVLPASIEERLQLYTTRNTLEDQNKNYKIVKHKFLNYRQLFLQVLRGKKEKLEAYALSYSTLPRKKAQVSVAFEQDGVFYTNREEVRLVTRKHFNTLANTNYNSIQELVYNPPSFEQEQKIRIQITQNLYDLTPIIVLEECPISKLTILLDAKVYEDTKETLIII
jgi:hypothetical protein